MDSGGGGPGFAPGSDVIVRADGGYGRLVAEGLILGHPAEADDQRIELAAVGVLGIGESRSVPQGAAPQVRSRADLALGKAHGPPGKGLPQGGLPLVATLKQQGWPGLAVHLVALQEIQQFRRRRVLGEQFFNPAGNALSLILDPPRQGLDRRFPRGAAQ